MLASFEGDFSEQGYSRGIAAAVSALLSAPSFLYRLERAAASADAPGAPLAAPEVLAARLSFLFWGSAPDEALHTAAREGRLASVADVEREARRLWRSPLARRGLWRFYEQWLGLADFHELEKNPRLFAWDAALRADLARELEAYVGAVSWDDDARFETLLTAPYSTLNARLLSFYGLSLGSGSALGDSLERVELPPELARSGLLTRGALLSAHAKVDQTSPVQRGKFVRERFFCNPPPPPPPELAVVAPVLDPRATTRERFARHRRDPACSSCHELMDPIGLGFEHYDAVGRYRAQEAGRAVDASGHLVGTDVDGPFVGVEELAGKLARSAEVRACFVRQWFRYALGRGEDAADACTLERLAQRFDASDGSIEELLVALVKSEPFLSPSAAPVAQEAL